MWLCTICLEKLALNFSDRWRSALWLKFKSNSNAINSAHLTQGKRALSLAFVVLLAACNVASADLDAEAAAADDVGDLDSVVRVV